jgi:polyhydroxybutyrate depolymerase
MAPPRTGLAALAAAVWLTSGCTSIEAGLSEARDAAPTTAPAVASTGCESPDERFAAVGSNGELVSDGQTRAFRIDVPSGPGVGARPLIVNLHGARVPRDAHENITGFASLGTAQGFIVATPQALGEHPIWRISDRGPDLAFIDRLISEIETRLCVDESRVYLVGFSMGGMMSMALACQHPERYAAIAVVAGTVRIPECERDTPVPLLAFHGTADDLVRFDGSYGEALYFLVPSVVDPPREEIVAEWARINDCGSDRETRRIPPDVELQGFACDADETVQLYVTLDGGHTWPGAEPGPFTPRVDDPSRTVDATELSLKFFQHHQRVSSH